ncbi:hypothetical protein EDC56_2503 [Sinobacterium caligoides]|uniref:Uncharacterized protein n=1 Tax=Sinobacterium caligoides TaxID=933926 RepID=A0A3N2DQH5_9GAMM|nr:hypothetical protein [Sinobacterium caligoides]ROS02053.1 hypothetical protein EDC56_2503 [Sinobacterium caligoides]
MFDIKKLLLIFLLSPFIALPSYADDVPLPTAVVTAPKITITGKDAQQYVDSKTKSIGMNYYQSIPLRIRYAFYQLAPWGLGAFTGADLSVKPDANDKQALREFAKKSEAQYVIFFPQVVIFSDHGQLQTKLKVNIYDALRNQLFFDEVFAGSAVDKASSDQCDKTSEKDERAYCPDNGALNRAIPAIMQAIRDHAINNVAWNEALKEKRFAILNEVYKTAKPDPIILETIKQKQRNIDEKSFYHGFISKDKRQFIAFFTGTRPKDRKKGQRTWTVGYIILGSKGDTGWTLQTRNEVPLNGCIDQHGHYQSCNSLGSASLEGKRKYYFLNLEKWGYFKLGSTERDPDFLMPASKS